MKFLFVSIALSFSCFAGANKIANYTYLKARKPIKKSITVKEVKRAYTIVKESTFVAPSKQDFFNDYLRFKMGVEIALNEKSLVRTPEINNKITSPFLRIAFEQELYKAFAELKLKKQMKSLDKASAKISNNTLKKLYNKDPEFNFLFVAINHPINPSSKQIKEAKQRSKKVYSQIIKSKKPFLELVTLYSDDKAGGLLIINRYKGAILPGVYMQLKKMKEGMISKPIRVPSGYFIVKLNKKVPFSKANKVAIKANYFNENRTRIFNTYFDSLKRDFKVNIVNKALIKSI